MVNRRLIYEAGRYLLAFYPAGRWRWEKEWQRRQDFRADTAQAPHRPYQPIPSTRR